MKHLFIIILVFSSCVHENRETEQDLEPSPLIESLLINAEDYSRLLYSAESEAIYRKFSDEIKNLIPMDSFKALETSIAEDLGGEIDVEDEFYFMLNGMLWYHRVSRFETYQEPLVLFWAIDEGGTITGFQLRELDIPPMEPYEEYQNPSPYHLPFSGTWLTLWAGRAVHENYHAISPPQRFAFDFLMVKNNYSFREEGRNNEDYYCFGAEIKAPLGGIVHEAADGIPDNVPGIMNADQPFGNYVLIDHQNGEYSVYAHLMEGSVRVSAGQKVASGDILGLCGNSGNSSEAHLHFHVQDSPDLMQGGRGMPVLFHDLYLNGSRERSAALTRGDSVRSAASGNN